MEGELGASMFFETRVIRLHAMMHDFWIPWASLQPQAFTMELRTMFLSVCTWISLTREQLFLTLLAWTLF